MRHPLKNGILLKSNQQHLYKVQIVAGRTFPDLRNKLNIGLVPGRHQPFCDKAWQDGQQGLEDVEVVGNGLRHIRWRQLEMLRRHAAGVHVTAHIVHATALEYGHHLKRPRMGTTRNGNTTSDKQQCHRKQYRQADMT